MSSKASHELGWIGLGRMGEAMAARLVKLGRFDEAEALLVASRQILEGLPGAEQFERRRAGIEAQLRATRGH